ncbi:VOC family protein [Streptacidiphilus fuscans]|uniref:VOC family protein n=1 Tax=Streptacidiphilus fuscans TaxID=2789292 RepID=A0A931FFS7_9ACTN|nr:VOC family protein [Streptacidiphilus fuscans]MBF9071928.1 VOC family protein [Streptacidiphilus fuscans]
MTLLRMDNVGVVVEDMDAAVAFFAELGLKREGEATLSGSWVESVVALDGLRCDIVMMRTPDGHGALELTKFHAPAVISPEPRPAPLNTLGLRRIMFEVDDLDDVIARLRTRGGELVGGVEQFEDVYRLCFLRSPEGILLGLAQRTG